MKVAIATSSPQKIAGVIDSIFRFFKLKESELEIYSKAIESGVSEQPFGDETYQGALNRLKGLKNVFPGMDIYVSCEAGIENAFGQYFNVQIVCLDYNSQIFWGKSSGWTIPSEDIETIKKINLDKYLRGKGITCIEELLGPSNSRSRAIAQATELALASGNLRNN